MMVPGGPQQLSGSGGRAGAAGPGLQAGGPDVVFEQTRGVVMLDAVKPPGAPPQTTTPQPPAATTQSNPQTARPPAPPHEPPAGATPLGTVRVAVLGNQPDLLPNLQAPEPRSQIRRH